MSNYFKDTVKPFLTKHRPEILLSMGIAGMTFATIWNIKATVKATRLVDKKKEELKVDKLSTKEVIKTVWKCYVPSVATIITSIPCLIAGNRISDKRNAALAAAYTISETALSEYKNKTKEILGEEKEKEISHAINQENVNKTYDKVQEVKMICHNGQSFLFKESWSGRYFESTWNDIQKAANELNAEAIGGSDIITLNTWFDSLGLESIDSGDNIGWSVYNGRNGLIDVKMDTCMGPDNRPCGVIEYFNEPKPLY